MQLSYNFILKRGLLDSLFKCGTLNSKGNSMKGIGTLILVVLVTNAVANAATGGTGVILEMKEHIAKKADSMRLRLRCRQLKIYLTSRSKGSFVLDYPGGLLID